MGRIRTYAEIAGDFNLWMEYVDPRPAMTRDAFDALDLESKIRRQVDLFGPEAERTLPMGLTAESVARALNGPRDQRIRDLERLLSMLDGWQTPAARIVRDQVEEGLAELVCQ
jgi:hypothetical protein